MRSAARLTYAQAHAALFLEAPEARAQLGTLVDSLSPLLDVAEPVLATDADWSRSEKPSAATG